MPHFHDFNPWASELAYIPDLEEFIELIPDDFTRVYPQEGEPFLAKTRGRYRSRIEDIGKYDLYVLEDGSAGVRLGKEPSQYLSPYVDTDKAKALWHKYTPSPFTVSIETALREAAQAGVNITIYYWSEKHWEAAERWHCDLEFKIKLEERGSGPEVIQAAWQKMKNLIPKKDLADGPSEQGTPLPEGTST